MGSKRVFGIVLIVVALLAAACGGRSDDDDTASRRDDAGNSMMGDELDAPLPDQDIDGIADVTDNCPEQSNPDQEKKDDSSKSGPGRITTALHGCTGRPE